MGLFRWVARKLMSIMGHAYVWLDRRVEYSQDEVESVLGLPIDGDLQTDTFWSLHSTQKIRFATQQIREMKKPSKMDMGY